MGNHKFVVSMKTVFAFAMLFLASCATLSPYHSTPPDALRWQQHQQVMQGLSAWTLRGKVAISNGKDGGQADVYWQQTDDQTYEIKLVAPFGAGSSVLVANTQQVSLDMSNGEHLVAGNINALLAGIPDWHFPVNGLRYWLFGIAAPHSSAQHMLWNEQGQLLQLEQDGWRIEYQAYTTAGAHSVPRKMFLQRLDNQHVELKLAVREWSLP